MPISSNAKFDPSYLDKVKQGMGDAFDASTSPTVAAIIRDIEQLYLLLGATSDGQTGSPQNADQTVGDGITTPSVGGDGGTADGNVNVANGTYGSASKVPVITVSKKSITTITEASLGSMAAQSSSSVSITGGTISGATAITLDFGSGRTVTINAAAFGALTSKAITLREISVCDGAGNAKTILAFCSDYY